MSAQPLTTVIVLNWNGKDDLLRCIGSLEPLLSEQFSVLVVDNGSTDGSTDALRQRFPGVEVLALEGNLGYAGGNNAGFRHAMQKNPEYVVFLNNDTVVAPDAVDILSAILRNDPKAGIAVPQISYLDTRGARGTLGTLGTRGAGGTLDTRGNLDDRGNLDTRGNLDDRGSLDTPDRIWYAGGEVRLGLGLVRHVGIRELQGPAYARRGETGYATGCCFAMRSADFAMLGGFDERFGMYCEDVDLSLRVRSAGFSVVYEPAARVWHRVSAAYGGSLKPRKLLAKSRAMLLLMAKHRRWSGIVLYPFTLFVQAAQALPRLFGRGGRS